MRTTLVSKWKGIVAGLALSIAFAGAARVAVARNGDGPAAGASAASAASPAETDATKGRGAADPNSPVLLELRELEEAVAAQAKQFDEHSKDLDAERAALRDELARIANLEAALGETPEKRGAGDSSSVAALVSGPAATDQTSQTQTPQDLSDRIGNIEDRLKNFGPFTFSGDFRLRDEPFFGGPSNESLDQNRERFRLRFNVTAKLNDDFGGGFSLWRAKVRRKGGAVDWIIWQTGTARLLPRLLKGRKSGLSTRRCRPRRSPGTRPSGTQRESTLGHVITKLLAYLPGSK